MSGDGALEFRRGECKLELQRKVEGSKRDLRLRDRGWATSDRQRGGCGFGGG